jgi:outer membrane protein assembly factor BamA
MFPNTLRRIASEPVVADTSMQPAKSEQLVNHLQQRGYLTAKVGLALRTKDRGVVEVFKVDCGPLYRFGTFRVSGANEVLVATVNELQGKFPSRFPTKGQPYQVAQLNQTRSWIAQQLRDRGYYRFTVDFLEFLADSNQLLQTVNLELRLLQPAVLNHHLPYQIASWELHIFPDQSRTARSKMLRADTLNLERYRVINLDDRIDSFLVFQQFSDFNNWVYSEVQLRNTLNRFAKLGLFAPGNYTILADDTLSSLRVRLDLRSLPKWQFRAESEVSTNSIALLGLNGNLGFTRRNAFGMGDLLDFRATLGAESQQVTGSEAGGSGFNTLEIGLRTQLILPGILKPGYFRKWSLTGNEQTIYSLNYQRQQRIDFDRNVLRLGLGVTGLVHSNIKYEIYPLELTYANTGTLSRDFQNLLDRLNDPLLRSNFVSYFNTSLRGTWIRDRLRESAGDYLRIGLESSGNLYGLLGALGVEGARKDSLWGLPYFRYFKADAEWRQHLQLNREGVLAFRLLGTFGIPLGEQNALPLEKRTFAGGTNSIRAWPVRGLGPGGLSNYATGRLIQFGEIRLESNAEWRFQILGALKGALFVDAGNIWTLNDSSSGGLGNFRWNRFIRQIALSQGAGLRYDFSYFVLRVDFALKFRDPALKDGQEWVVLNWLDREWRTDGWRQAVQSNTPVGGEYPLFSTVFGINYPF